MFSKSNGFEEGQPILLNFDLSSILNSFKEVNKQNSSQNLQNQQNLKTLTYNTKILIPYKVKFFDDDA